MQQNFSAKSKLNIIKKVIISAKYHNIPNEAESLLQVIKYEINMMCAMWLKDRTLNRIKQISQILSENRNISNTIRK
jgi:hypothetical protein